MRMLCLRRTLVTADVEKLILRLIEVMDSPSVYLSTILACNDVGRVWGWFPIMSSGKVRARSTDHPSSSLRPMFARRFYWVQLALFCMIANANVVFAQNFGHSRCGEINSTTDRSNGFSICVPFYDFGVQRCRQSVGLVSNHVIGQSEGTFDRPSIQQSTTDVFDASDLNPLCDCLCLAIECDESIMSRISAILFVCDPSDVEWPFVVFTFDAFSTRVVAIIVAPINSVIDGWSWSNQVKKDNERVSESFAYFYSSASIVFEIGRIWVETSLDNAFPNTILRSVAEAVSGTFNSHGCNNSKLTPRMQGAFAMII